MTKTSDQLPSTWLSAPISDVADINPRVNKADIPDHLEVSFVPMPAVQELTGRMDVAAWLASLTVSERKKVRSLLRAASDIKRRPLSI